MLKSGLCSISFRSLDCDQIIYLCLKTGLEAIEWGGDVHCPHGDIEKAAEVAQKCQKAGLACPSYGSYYRAGVEDSPDFSDVAASAKALGAEIIRIWAGNISPDKADENYWQTVCDDAKRISEIAQAHGCKIAFEYHQNTLTENRQSTNNIMKILPDNNILFYWQPPHGDSVEDCLAGIEEVLPRLSNLHVFYWGPKGWNEKFLLKDGRERWAKFLTAANPQNATRYAFLEFAKDDKVENTLLDAKILNDLIQQINS